MTSNEELARQVREHAEALRAVMGDPMMAPDSELATYSRPENWRTARGQTAPTPERMTLVQSAIKSRLAEFPELQKQRKAIVLAGPPGAGKGYVSGKFLEDVSSYVQCDPDEFKAAIVRHELQVDGLESLKTDLVRSYEAEGHVFAPLEFASLVHDESSAINARLQANLLRDGSNLIFDTVLGSQKKAEALAETLVQAGYTFEVVSVQTTAEISRASRHDRWREPYELFLQGRHELGGRPVPSEFANNMFPDDGGSSLPERSAEWLAENSPACLRYRVYRRSDADGGHVLEVDKRRVSEGDPLLTRAEVKAHRAASFARSQTGPLRSSGLGATPPRGPQQNPKKPRGNSPSL